MAKVLLSLLLLFHSLCNAQRAPRYLSVFTIVRFSADACVGFYTNRWGECKAYANCYMDGGYGDGPCADGYGVCCLNFVTACQSNVKKNVSYIQNPDYPTGYSTTINTCDYFVQKCDDSVCQVRLDFESLLLTSPVTNSAPTTPAALNSVQSGTCYTDTLNMVASSGDSFGPMCGLETGSQHIYMDIGNDPGDSLTLKFGINTAASVAAGVSSTADRTWSIRVTQIPCWSRHMARQQCRQYLTGTSGTVQSLNWANSAVPQLYQATYSICVRREEGYCKVCWKSTADPNSFQTDSEVPTATIKYRGNTACRPTAAAGRDRASVWIYDSNETGGRDFPTFDIYCGPALDPSYLCSLNSFRIDVDFVSPPAPTSAFGDGQRGFRLEYRQIPCST